MYYESNATTGMAGCQHEIDNYFKIILGQGGVEQGGEGDEGNING